jgi:hypothetical protein
MLGLILLSLLLTSLPAMVWAVNLPLNKELTVRLSTVSEDGILSLVADTQATSDSSGKIVFSFTAVPDSTSAKFLLLQIIDGNAVLRQTIVPTAEPGKNIDLGISEVTDIQASIALKVAEISGRLTPLHLLLAQTMFRSPGFSQSDITEAGAAVVQAAAALEAKIAAEEGGTKLLPLFLKSVAASLDSAATFYRKSVDDALSLDPKLEAYRRGEAFADLMRSFINGGADAGIALDTLCTAFSAAGAAAEDSVKTLSPAAFEAIRAGFITGQTQCGAYRYIREYRDALTAVGILPDHFTGILIPLNFLDQQLTFNQIGFEGEAFSDTSLPDQQVMVLNEFNSFASHDLLLLKISLDYYQHFQNNESEYESFLTDIAARMSGMGGVMAGTTAASLKTYLDSNYFVVSGQNMLAAWNFLISAPAFSYTPIPGLTDQIVLPLVPPVAPDTGQFSGAYRDMILLAYDLTLLTYIQQSDFMVAENALPADPPAYLSLEKVSQIKNSDLLRRAMVRQNISGIDPVQGRVLVNLLQNLGEAAMR